MDENQEKELKNEELVAKENIEKEQTEENQEQSQEEVIKDLVETKEAKKKKEKKPRKGNYITGTIGAILGGAIIATLWVIIYLFANHMVIPIIGTLIPVGAFLGYKIFRGKIGKPTRSIITIISLVLIVLVTTVICPSILLVESQYEITLENLAGLYTETRDEIRDVIIEDLIAGSIFTTIGIILIIIFGINKKINNSVTEEQTKQFKEEIKNELKEKAKVVKEVCQTLNAMDSENLVKKKSILKELKNTYKLKRKQRKQYFVMCKLAKLLTKQKGKYYYDENDEENKIEQAPKIDSKIRARRIIKNLIKVLIIAIIIAAIVVYYLFFVEKPYNVAGTNIVLKPSNTQDFYGTPEKIEEEFGEDAANYYEFIINDKNKKYELYGQVIPKSQYGEKEMGAIIQEERDYYAPYLGEDVTSQVEDKQFGDELLKSYNYTTIGTDGNTYRAIIYLCEDENNYLWINVYTYYEVEVTQIDTIVNDLII